MGMVELHGFTGTAMVLGTVRQVKYVDSQLTIEGLDLANAQKILNALDNGKIQVAALPEAHPGQTAQTTQTATPAKKEKAHEKKAEVAAAPTAPAAQFPDRPQDQLPETLGGPKAPEAQAAAPASSEPTAPAGQPAAAAAVSPAPAGIAHAAKLREVVAFIQDQGIKDLDGIVAECERLKPSVPLLSRIANMKERVKRTIEVMEGGVAAN